MIKKINLIFGILVFGFAGVFISAQEVKMQVGVFDESGNFYGQLKTTDFRLLQEKKSAPIISVEPKFADALEIIIMIDASVSQEAVMPQEREAAIAFIKNVLDKDKDKVAVVKFSGSLLLEQDLTNEFSKAIEKIKQIDFEPPPGYNGGGVVSKDPNFNKSGMLAASTPIWDSINQVLQSFAKIKSDSRKAILLISDGTNTSGEAKLKETLNLALKSRIPIFAIGIGDDEFGGADKKTLQKLTEQTNGTVIFKRKKPEDLLPQIKMLATSLRSFYEVTFTANSKNSKESLQEVKIEIINPDFRKRKFQILQPKGFFFSN